MLRKFSGVVPTKQVNSLAKKTMPEVIGLRKRIRQAHDLKGEEKQLMERLQNALDAVHRALRENVPPEGVTMEKVKRLKVQLDELDDVVDKQNTFNKWDRSMYRDINEKIKKCTDLCLEIRREIEDMDHILDAVRPGSVDMDEGRWENMQPKPAKKTESTPIPFQRMGV
eukprot:comp6661_c0_seq1/m.2435 comp6661_c0_seq1/g.2435  ORF comp6661_c0_seq1/g.2435 comp6661_c0_seq1/m.2435 type:complete len:169 (-) comp6661_c0_seq1:83-589(-)